MSAPFFAPFSRVFSKITKRTVLYVSLAFSNVFDQHCCCSAAAAAAAAAPTPQKHRSTPQQHDRPPPSTAALRINQYVQPPRTQASPSLQTPLRARGGDTAAQVAQQRRSLVRGPSDDSSAQGRGLSSATTVYLQAPPPTALPKPEHRPNCRCPVNNTRVVVGESLSWRAPGGMGAKEHRMLLSVTLCFGPLTTHTKTISSPSFLYSSPHTLARSPTHIQ